MRLLVPLVLVSLLSVPSLQAALDEEPHLLVRIQNDGPARSVDLSIVEMGTRRSVFDGAVALGANDLTTVRIDAAPSEYFASIVTDSADPEPLEQFLDGDPGVGASVDSQGCRGPAAIDFGVGEHSLWGGDSGCLDWTDDARALLAEARAARAGVPLARFEIPAPGDADRGVIDRSLFEWRTDVEFRDAWGGVARGAEVRYQSGSYSTTGATPDGPDVGEMIKAEVDDSVESFFFREGEARPHAWSSTMAGFGSDQSRTSASVTVERELRYHDAPHTLACALRNGLQGRAIRPGDAFAPADVCPSWGGPEWRAYSPVEIEGHRLLPLYQIDESAGRTLVSRIYLLDGVPYPLAMERHSLVAGGPLRSDAMVLERYQHGGDPIALTRAAAKDPELALEPLDPLRGPALGASGARVPFPLAEASDAARADPSLRDVQTVLARPDAALIGALYVVARDEGSPLVMLRWALLFGAADAKPAAVVCVRPQTALPVSTPARCTAPGPGEPTPFEAPPRVGRGELPTRAASFAQALARWDAVRQGASGEAMTVAAYRAWAEHDAPFLAVGSGVAAPLSPAGGGTSGEADFVALELATARTLAQVEVVQAGETLAAAPLGRVGPTTLHAADAPLGEAGAIPVVIGASVGVALLALLGFLLYSRLVRSRVLDDATRAAIHDVVASEPGLHASAILDHLGKRSGVGEYHLDVLVREGYLTSVATSGFRRYHVTGRHTPGEMRALAALREGRNETLMQIIRANPGIELRMLAAEAGVSVPYVSRSVARLAEAGLVEKVQVGRAIAVHAVEA